MKKLVIGLALAMVYQASWTLPERVNSSDFIRLDNINKNKLYFRLTSPGFKTDTCGLKVVYTPSSSDTPVNISEIMNDLFLKENEIPLGQSIEQDTYIYYFTKPYENVFVTNFSFKTISGKNFSTLIHDNNLDSDGVLGLAIIPCR